MDQTNWPSQIGYEEFRNQRLGRAYNLPSNTARVLIRPDRVLAHENQLLPKGSGPGRATSFTDYPPKSVRAWPHPSLLFFYPRFWPPSGDCRRCCMILTCLWVRISVQKSWPAGGPARCRRHADFAFAILRAPQSCTEIEWSGES